MGRELTAELRRDQAAAARRARIEGPVGRIGESGRRDMAVPMDAFLRGSRLNGSECWSDAEFCRDMVKRYPHLGVEQRGRAAAPCAHGRRRSGAGLRARYVVREGRLVKIYERDAAMKSREQGAAEAGTTGGTMRAACAAALVMLAGAAAGQSSAAGWFRPDRAAAAVKSSPRAVVWTDAGGSGTQAMVIATSPVLAGGVAEIAYDQGGTFAVLAQMSADAGDTWVAFGQTNGAVMVRVSLADDPPAFPGGGYASNIVVSGWVRPALFGAEADLRGQVVRVSEPVGADQPVTLSGLQTAVGAVTSRDWSSHPATQAVYMAGHPLVLGGGWSLEMASGYGVLSHGELTGSATGAVWAVDGEAVLTAQSGLAGLAIESFAVDGGTGTVGVATNGVIAEPFLQWSASLGAPYWTALTALTNTYPAATSNGVFEVVAVLPAGSGFVRAMQRDGTRSVDVSGALRVDGVAVVTSAVSREPTLYTGTNVTLGAAAYSFVATPTNAVTIAWSPVDAAERYVVDVQAFSGDVYWPTNWTWRGGVPTAGTNGYVVSVYPWYTNGLWAAVGVGL